MEGPFAWICDTYYQWILDKTNPEGAAELGIQFIPKHYWYPWGLWWNLGWYRDVALQTGLSSKPELVKVDPARLLPPSYHTYSNELDGVRKSVEGTAALKKNYKKVQGYKDLEKAEENCFERLRVGIDTRDEIETMIKEAHCRVPKTLYNQDIKKKVEEWRASAVSCLTRHSVEHGDGNRRQFDECLENYNKELIVNGTSEENLTEWAHRYVKLFEPGAIKITSES